jgi:hypothetical protein
LIASVFSGHQGDCFFVKFKTTVTFRNVLYRGFRHYLLPHQISDDVCRGFMGGYGFCQQPVRRQAVNGYGAGDFTSLSEKPGSAGSGNRWISGVIFVPLIRFFISHPCHDFSSLLHNR